MNCSSNAVTKLAAGLASLLALFVFSLAGCNTKTAPGPKDPTGSEVKVGILHSLSGTMAISEASLKDAELMAINEINEAGGVLGKKIVPMVEDPASDFFNRFPELAKKLLKKEKVVAVFGLSGVGKSWMISRYAAAANVAHIQASQLMRDAIVARAAPSITSEDLRRPGSRQPKHPHRILRQSARL